MNLDDLHARLLAEETKRFDPRRGLERLRSDRRRLDADPGERHRLDQIISDLEAEDAAYHAGCTARERGDLESAATSLRRAAEAGHPEAAYELAAVLDQMAHTLERQGHAGLAESHSNEAKVWRVEAVAAGVIATADEDREMEREPRRPPGRRLDVEAAVPDAVRDGDLAVSRMYRRGGVFTGRSSPLDRREAERARERLEQVITRLFHRQAAPLATYLVAMGARPADAEDLVNDAFLATLAHGGRLSLAEENLEAYLEVYLYRTARDQYLTLVRKQGHREVALEATEPSDDPTAAIDQRVDLLAAIARLPARQREVVWLRYDENRGIAEIAAILQISQAAVRTSLSRARRRLQIEVPHPQWKDR